MTKYVQDHPEWSILATRHDDLKYILLKYGQQLSPNALKAVRTNFRTVVRRIRSLEKKLGDEGWLE